MSKKDNNTVIFEYEDYFLIKEDEWNFGLYQIVEKGLFRGEKKEGTKEKLIGYYGYIDMAMSKLVNLELLNHKGKPLVAEEIIIGFNTVKDKLEHAYHIRSKDM